MTCKTYDKNDYHHNLRIRSHNSGERVKEKTKRKGGDKEERKKKTVRDREAERASERERDEDKERKEPQGGKTGTLYSEKKQEKE